MGCAAPPWGGGLQWVSVREFVSGVAGSAFPLGVILQTSLGALFFPFICLWLITAHKQEEGSGFLLLFIACIFSDTTESNFPEVFSAGASALCSSFTKGKMSPH